MGNWRASGHKGRSDTCGFYFARDGSQVRLEMNGRVVAIGLEGMRAIPNRVGVSGGPGEAMANIGAGHPEERRCHNRPRRPPGLTLANPSG
ncbi:MAG: hypothetical protein AVDCRST_MAG12-164 [uncultured Rubrobacteraceae bacterium]|uniref:Uncharacterized protein n=1 Tax=uncultured Rubrobacteraceae bacterium TaxID=349277 RepID=A0A6J4R5G0_9ACTN|nr:MAG: hypothetical protein AVDCRST_MAG12-164 [uncultured Rubrobacteraceae bacterium]